MSLEGKGQLAEHATSCSTQGRLVVPCCALLRCTIPCCTIVRCIKCHEAVSHNHVEFAVPGCKGCLNGSSIGWLTFQADISKIVELIHDKE